MSDKAIVYSSRMFGQYSPYFSFVNGRARVFQTIEEAGDDFFSGEAELDVAAVLSLLNFPYIAGDRTLVRGISRIPWHSDVGADGRVFRHPPFPHDDLVMREEEVAERMHDLLLAYLKDHVVRNHKTIWLTLSGGYDSRIVAGLLTRAVTNDNKVKVLNWGIPNSRDVIYAKQIAQYFGWDYVFIPYSLSQLYACIDYTVREMGAEISFLDYNPIEVTPEILNSIRPEDAILFAHYGNGVGRASYAGKHLSNIRPRRIVNPLSLFNRDHFGTYARIVCKDRESAWYEDNSKECVKIIAQNELDMHENYMRRMLTKRFRFCKKFDPFTDDELVRFVYSLSVTCRNDAVYKKLLKSIDDYLFSLPTAKTGRSFEDRKADKKGVGKQHNKAGDLLEMYGKISDTLLSGCLVRNGVLSRTGIGYMVRLWEKDPHLSSLVSRLYGVELLIDKMNLKVDTLNLKKLTQMDSCVLSFADYGAKKVKNQVRSIWKWVNQRKSR